MPWKASRSASTNAAPAGPSGSARKPEMSRTGRGDGALTLQPRGSAEQRDQRRIVELDHAGDAGGGRGEHHDAVRAERWWYTTAAGWPLAVVAIIRQSPGAPRT